MAADPTPKELAYWIYKKMQTNKQQAKYTLHWLLLPAIAKMNIKECAGSGS